MLDRTSYQKNFIALYCRLYKRDTDQQEKKYIEKSEDGDEERRKKQKSAISGGPSSLPLSVSINDNGELMLNTYYILHNGEEFWANKHIIMTLYYLMNILQLI